LWGHLTGRDGLNCEYSLTVGTTEPTLSHLVEHGKIHIAQLQVALDRPRDATQIEEPTTAGYEKVLTHVGGVSLFLESRIDTAEVVFPQPPHGA
jgi:hypothetical protein